MFAGPLGEYISQRTWSMVVHKGRNHGPRLRETGIGPLPRSLWIQCTSHASWHGLVRVSMATGGVWSSCRSPKGGHPLWGLKTSFYPRSDIDESSMLIGWLSGGKDVQRRILPHFGWSSGIRRFCYPSTSRNTIVLGRRWAFSMFKSCIMVQLASKRLPNAITVLNSSLAPFQASCVWSDAQLQGVSATFERKGFLCTPLL